jgi:hypothetical protein
MGRMVAEVMTRDPICASADSPVSEAPRRMADADVGAGVRRGRRTGGGTLHRPRHQPRTGAPDTTV